MERIVLGDDDSVKGGVYVLRVGRRFYFGLAKNFRVRRNQHFTDLRRGVHCNPVLQRAYNKLGEHCVSFEPIVWCCREEAARIESELIRACSCVRTCANLRIEDGSTFEFSKESLAKMSASRRGRKWSAERIAAHRATMAANGTNRRTKETCRNISNALRGRKKRAGWVRKIATAKTKPVLVLTPSGTSFYFLSAAAAAIALGYKEPTNVNGMASGKRQPPARLAGYRFSYLDKTRENWSPFPTACTHEHYETPGK